MKKAVAILGAVILFGGIASAESTDTTLITPPGYYAGSGGDQNGWATSTDNIMELGLTAIDYGIGAPGDTNLGPVNPGSIVGNVYTVPAGLSPIKATRAAWSFNWSINTNIGSDIALTNFAYDITVTDLSQAGDPSVSFDPTAAALGDSPMGDWGSQNSANPLFVYDVPAGYSINNDDNYEITLTATGLGAYAGYSNSDTIFVEVGAPEPSTITLAGLFMVGLWFVRRRQMQRS